LGSVIIGQWGTQIPAATGIPTDGGVGLGPWGVSTLNNDFKGTEVIGMGALVPEDQVEDTVTQLTHDITDILVQHNLFPDVKVLHVRGKNSNHSQFFVQFHCNDRTDLKAASDCAWKALIHVVPIQCTLIPITENAKEIAQYGQLAIHRAHPTKPPAAAERQSLTVRHTSRNERGHAQTNLENISKQVAQDIIAHAAIQSVYRIRDLYAAGDREGGITLFANCVAHYDFIPSTLKGPAYSAKHPNVTPVQLDE
jgi:hypothetical protein